MAKTKDRTVERVEAELAKVKEESRALISKYREIPDLIGAALDAEDHGEVSRLQNRRAELPGRVYNATRKTRRLEIELSEIELSELTAEIQGYADEALKKSEEANRLRGEAERANGLASALRDERIEKQKHGRGIGRDLEALEAAGLDGFAQRLANGSQRSE